MAVRSPAHLALGTAIRNLRSERGLSQEGLGLEAGMDRTYVGSIERGERNPSYTNLLKLAHTLGVRGSELLAAAEKEELRLRKRRS